MSYFVRPDLVQNKFIDAVGNHVYLIHNDAHDADIALITGIGGIAEVKVVNSIIKAAGDMDCYKVMALAPDDISASLYNKAGMKETSYLLRKDINTVIQPLDVSKRYSLKHDQTEVGRMFMYSITRGKGRFGYLEDLMIDESHRGQNLGAKLYERAAYEAARLGFPWIEMTSRHSKPGFHEYIRKLGYEKVGAAFRKDL